MKAVPPIVWCDLGFVLLVLIVAGGPSGGLMLIGIGYGTWRLWHLFHHGP